MFAVVATASLLLGGCSAGDVEFQGKIFDAMGVSGAGQRSKDPKLADRAPLVLPPSLERLPQPGSDAPPEEQTELAAIVDPDRHKTATKAELERQQAEFCKVHYEQAKARGDLEADNAKGPLGPCRASILTSLPKALEGKPEE